MEVFKNNDAKLIGDKTVNALIDSSPQVFNDLVDAIDGVAEVTDSGLDRIVKAVDGLSGVIATSGDTKQASKAITSAVAKEIQVLERLSDTEIKTEKEQVSEVVKKEKPVSVDIGKALSSFKPNKPEFYQPSNIDNSVSKTTNVTQVFNENSSTNEQSIEQSSRITNNAGGSETVFNQLDNTESKSHTQNTEKGEAVQVAKEHKSSPEVVSPINISAPTNEAVQPKAAQEKPAAKQRVSPQKQKSTKVNGEYYKDSKGRLRTPKGKFATKEEQKQFDKLNRKKTIKATIAKHINSERGRQVIGTALLGSAYPALQGLYEGSENIKNGIQERGLTSVDGVKAYANKKQDKLKQSATEKIETTKAKGGKAISFAKGLFSKKKKPVNSAAKGKARLKLDKPVKKELKSKPSTVDGLEKKASNQTQSPLNKASTVLKVVGSYIKKHGNKDKKSSANKSTIPLTNGVFISAQNSGEISSEKLSKENHNDLMLKLDKLIKGVEDISINAGGGGGGSIIDDVLDFNRDRKGRKRNKGSRPRSKLGKAKDFLKSGRFFGGGAKVAGAVGAGAVGAGAVGAGAGGVASKAASIGKLGAGALGGLGRVASKAVPLLAIASTAYDAYDGFTNKEKQQETFNLKSTEEANLGQKTSMALGSVLDLGGLTSGAAGLLGDGLGALGFDGAKEALNFDSGDIAKAIYGKGEAIVSSGSDTLSALGQGDFSAAAGSAGTFLKELFPVLGVFSGSDSKEKLEQIETATSNTSNANSIAAGEANAPSEPDSKASGQSEPTALQKRVDARRKSVNERKERIKAENGGVIPTSSTEEVRINGSVPAITSSLAMNTNRESITDISSINTGDGNSTPNQRGQQSNAPVVITDNAKSIALLKEISKKLELNRKTEKPNNIMQSGAINSLPTNVPAQFSDPLMERLANE